MVKEGGSLWAVQAASRTVIRTSTVGQDYRVTGLAVRIRVVTKNPRSRRATTFLYFGRARELTFNPDQILWSGNIPFFHYTTKLGCQLLDNRYPSINLTTTK
jgi:hypothetical protein